MKDWTRPHVTAIFKGLKVLTHLSDIEAMDAVFSEDNTEEHPLTLIDEDNGREIEW